MKKYVMLRYALLFSILVVFSNCNREDSSLEIIDSPQTIEQPQTKGGGLGIECDREVIVNFNFLPGTTEREKIRIKTQYYDSRKNEITICLRIAGDGDCPDSEKWIVSSKDYQPPYTTRGGSETSTGNAEEGGAGPFIGWPIPPFDGANTLKNAAMSCFDDGRIVNFQFYNEDDDSFEDSFDNGDADGDNGSDGFGNWH